MEVTTHMNRLTEPERMTDVEVAHYIGADYSEPHEAYAKEIVERAHVANDAVLLDLGCGPGDLLVRLRRRVDWTLMGLDISPQFLGHAQTDALSRLPPAAKPVAWLLGDSKNTGLPAGFADIIISNSVLHRLSDAVAFWREIKRLSKPGTFVFVRDLRRPVDEVTGRAITAKHVGTESEVVQELHRWAQYTAYTTDEVVAQLGEAGLEGLTVSPLLDRYLDVSGRVE